MLAVTVSHCHMVAPRSETPENQEWPMLVTDGLQWFLKFGRGDGAAAVLKHTTNDEIQMFYHFVQV